MNIRFNINSNCISEILTKLKALQRHKKKTNILNEQKKISHEENTHKKRGIVPNNNDRNYENVNSESDTEKENFNDVMSFIFENGYEDLVCIRTKTTTFESLHNSRMFYVWKAKQPCNLL